MHGGVKVGTMVTMETVNETTEIVANIILAVLSSGGNKKGG